MEETASTDSIRKQQQGGVQNIPRRPCIAFLEHLLHLLTEQLQQAPRLL